MNTLSEIKQGEQAIANPPKPELNPGRIMETGMAFWASKTLLTAIKLELFTFLSNGSRSGEEIREELGLHPRSLYDFLDALVAMGFLNRAGIKETARYYPTAESGLFLDKNKPTYVGGILEMSNERLYPFWGHLEEALKTGLPQNEVKLTGKPIFEALYADQNLLEHFMTGMAGAQVASFIAFAQHFDFSSYSCLADIGGANGILSKVVAEQHPHMKCLSLDLPPVEPVAKKFIEQFGLSGRVSTCTIDFMIEEFPAADVITMGNILHDWDLETKKSLVQKAYNALPSGGALVVIENIIDNERKHNAFGLLMSLNMLIETEAGYDYSFSEFESWAREAGFGSCILLPLAGPSSAAIAYKS